ncbi:MAG: hypothetical protein ABTQ31_17860 [Rhizobiaceae bacterium]
MIYMVECALSGETSQAEWNEWYADMKPPQLLLSVPGLDTVQRFQGVEQHPVPYLALYSVQHEGVMTSDAYRSIGGGRFLTDVWASRITGWRRNLFDGAAEAPRVGGDRLLVLIDVREEPAPRDGIVWLHSVALDKSTSFRGLAIVDREELSALREAFPSARAFRPLMDQERER